jgi:hypothetical protein
MGPQLSRNLRDDCVYREGRFASGRENRALVVQVLTRIEKTG